jgi:hypothetical protein
MCNMFLKKKKIFRPAGGETDRSSRQSPGLDTQRVTRVIYTTYAVTRSNRTFDPVQARIACGSVVLVYLFHETRVIQCR